MRTLSYIVVAILLTSTFSLSQQAGDFRTKANGNWSAYSTVWEQYDGSQWIPATKYPDRTDGNISVNHNVTVNLSINIDQTTVASGKTLRVNSNATLTISGTGNGLIVNGSLDLYGYLNLYADCLINGTLIMHDGTVGAYDGVVKYGSNGTLQYSITSPILAGDEFPDTYGPNNLTMDAEANITVPFNRTIPGTLTMVSGYIIMSGNNTLTLGTSPSNLGTLSHDSPDQGRIVGNFARWFAASTVSDVKFPIGTTSRYREVYISFTQAPTSGGTIRMRAYTTDPSYYNSGPIDDNGYTVDTYSQEAWWQMTVGNGLSGGVYNISLRASNISGVSSTNYPLLRSLKRDNGSSLWYVEGTHQNATGSASTPVIRRQGLSTATAQFGVGGNYQDGNTLNSPLPVKLATFQAYVNQNSVILNWVTSIEENNYGFEIYRSDYGKENWSYIGFVKGNGTKNTQSNYRFEDKNLSKGQYEYALKQIDYNGNYEYFYLNDFVTITPPNKFFVSQNYPNPFNPVTKIDYELPERLFVSLVVYDISGREVKSLINEYQDAGYYTLEFNAFDLSSGVYFYRFKAGDYIRTMRMTLIK
ncbi:MAG: T9SS type A sorting domain-containing protein [Ignavibacteria bacterium]|nr:T9SS type A sorting domain-containing protein [Ignavibacteria bacterium]